MEHELAQSDGEWVLREDEGHVAEIEQAMSLLDGYLNTLKETQAVSRGQIETIVGDVPDLLPVSVKVASFTQEPSPTNLEIAQEGLVQAVGRKIVDLAKAIWELIKKSFEWIVNFLKGMRDRLVGLIKRDKQIKALSQAVARNQEVGLRSVVLSPSDSRKADGLRNDMKLMEAQLRKIWTPLHRAVINNDQAVVQLRSYAMGLPTQIDTIQRFVMNLEELVRGETTTLMPICTPHSPEKRAWDQNEKIATEIQILNEVGSKEEPMSFNEIIHAFANDKRDLGRMVLSNMDLISRNSDRLKRIMQRQPQFSGLIKHEQDHRDLQTWLEFLKALTGSVRGVITAVQRVERIQADLIGLVNQWLAKDYELDLIYANAARGELAEAAQATHHDLQKRLKA